MAQAQLPRYYRKAFQDYSGGLNNFASPLRIAPNEFAELENFAVNDKGILEKLKGYTKDATVFSSDTTHFIRMAVNYKRGTSVDKLVVSALDSANANASYKVDTKETQGNSSYDYVCHTTGTAQFTNGSTTVTGTGTSWSSHLKAGDKIKAGSHADSAYAEIQTVGGDTSITLTANYSGASTGAAVAYKARIMLHKDFVPTSKVFNNNLLITNGSEKPMTYNNTTLNLLTDADCPRGKFIEIHKSRVFLASTSGSPSSIYWSAVNDETAWDASAFEPVFPQDNGNIVAIKSFADSLLVFKDNGNIYQVIGSFDQSAVGEPDYIRRVDTPENIGIVAGRTCVVHDDGSLYFLTETGIYRLDSRMQIEKVSWAIDGTTADINFQLGPSNSKSYLYDSQAQWQTGTLASGMRANSDGTITPYFDLFTYTDAAKGYNSASVFTDSSGKTHVLYISSSNTLLYKRLGIDNTVEISRTVNLGTFQYLYSCAIAVSSTGIVGILAGLQSATVGHAVRYLSQTSYATGTATFTNGSTALTGSGTSWLTNVTAGDYIKPSGTDTWYEVLTVNSDVSITLTSAFAGTTATGSAYLTSAFSSSTDLASSGTQRVAAVSIAFSSDNPRVCYVFSDSDGVANLAFRKYSSSAWQTAVTVQNNTGSGSYVHKRCSMDLNASNNPRISATFDTTSLRFYLSDDDGASWSQPDGTLSVVLASVDNIQLDINASGQAVTGFSDSGTFKTRNHATATTASVDTTLGSVLLGFQTSSGNNYAYTMTGTTPNHVEKYRFAGTSVFSNGSANVIDTTGYRCGDRQMSYSSNVFSTLAFGANANELVVRRLAFSTTWTGPETSDSTLSAWGTYVVDGQLDNSGTILHEVALATSSPATSYSTILNGSVISTDATLVFVIPRITVTLGSFAAPVVGSITLNYTGAGVDARQPLAVVFDNQIYLSVCLDSGASNNALIIMDTEGKWTTSTHPVSAMCRYKGNLWAGKATNGDVLKLLLGFSHAGTAYTATAVTKEDFLGSLELTKEVYKVYVLYEVKSAGTFDFAYRLDNFSEASGSSWTTVEVDQTDSGLVEIDVKKTCKTIQFKVLSSDLDADMGIVGFVVLHGYLNLR